jgi:hypothetical protein
MPLRLVAEWVIFDLFSGRFSPESLDCDWLLDPATASLGAPRHLLRHNPPRTMTMMVLRQRHRAKVIIGASMQRAF